jgi:hypothetical protein
MNDEKKCIEEIKKLAHYTVGETPFGEQINIGFDEKKLAKLLREYKGAKCR